MAQDVLRTKKMLFTASPCENTSSNRHRSLSPCNYQCPKTTSKFINSLIFLRPTFSTMLSYFQGLLVSDHYIWVLKTSTNKASDHKEMADKDPELTEHAL